MIKVCILNKSNEMFPDSTCSKKVLCVYQLQDCTPCLKKTVQNCFCHNFVRFPPTLIILGTLIAERINLCDVHLFSTSPNSRQRPTVLNADVLNCYITL